MCFRLLLERCVIELLISMSNSRYYHWLLGFVFPWPKACICLWSYVLKWDPSSSVLMPAIFLFFFIYIGSRPADTHRRSDC